MSIFQVVTTTTAWFIATNMELPFTFLVSGFVKWLKIIVNRGCSQNVVWRKCWAIFNEYWPCFTLQKVKFTLEQATKAQRGRRGIPLLFLYLGLDGGGWSKLRLARFTPGEHPVPIVQEAGWVPVPLWTGAESLAPHRDSIPGSSSP